MFKFILWAVSKDISLDLFACVIVLGCVELRFLTASPRMPCERNERERANYVQVQLIVADFPIASYLHWSVAKQSC